VDVPPTPPPPTPQTPYRAGKPLADIIPPDRRHLKAAALVVSSMVAGIALWVLGGWVLELVQGERVVPSQTPPTRTYVAGRVGSATLRGPGGTISLPPARRSIVNVWLQGCSDCMPAFEAMAALEREGGFGFDAPIINVAYGEADVTWAQRYGVAKGLVFDPGGGKVVKPLGIGTFTTLVVEPDGSIIHRDRPDRPGYAARVRAALQSGIPVPTYPGPESEMPPGQGDPFLPVRPLGQEAVQRVVASHTTSIRRTCWEPRAEDRGPSSANITVNLTIAPNGTVSASSATGDDAVVARCIEAQTRSWSFPAPGAAATVSIPFKFVRQ
jgi:hypothetical protein